jgi:nitrogenase iron protein NifH
MIRLAIYGKGGIGKSTVAANLSMAFAQRGFRVLQIGCDPKADSTLLLREGRPLPSVMDLVRKKEPFGLSDMVMEGREGIFCAEAGGPLPGLGCAGRGIITALEKLEEMGVYKECRPDIVLYDVLGDVVCGGFAMPMRQGYADHVYVVTSGENMSVYAAANICTAVSNFKKRGYADLGGLILNRRRESGEEVRVKELAEDFDTVILGDIRRSLLIPEAEEKGQTLLEYAPESLEAGEIRALSEAILKQNHLL